MKEIGVVSWKLPLREMSCQHFREFSPSENNHVYSTMCLISFQNEFAYIYLFQ